MDFYMPVKLYTGSEVLKKHSDVFKGLGKRCFIVTGKHSAVASGALDDLLDVLKETETEYEIFNEIKANPPMEDCVRAGRQANAFSADYIVGIGGGSALDAAKVIAMTATQPELTEASIYAGDRKDERLPLVLIGTTAGTGSEVTKVAVCTNQEGRKKSIHSDLFYADYAFGDPKYTCSLTKEISVSTGIDALTHCLESYFSNKANEISRACAVRGIRKMWNALCLLNEDKELSLKDREDLYEASILGGLAICVTGTTFGHNIGYYLTEAYHLPHGLACAVFIKDVVAFAKRQNEDYVNAFFAETGITEEDFLSVTGALIKDVKVSMSMDEVEAIMPRYVNNSSIKNTFGTMSPEDVRELLISKFVD